jgi:peptide/nickel transport system permease protein
MSSMRALAVDTAPRRSGIGERQPLWRRLLRNPRVLAGLFIIGGMTVIAALAPVTAPSDPLEQVLLERLRPPSLEHPFGTDGLGRDMLSRAIWGARVSLGVGLSAMAVSVLIGTVLGVAAGFLGGWVDNVLMRIADVFIALPAFLLLLTIVTIYGSSVGILIFFLGLTAWPATARLVRGEALSLVTREFVLAARVIGASNVRIMALHVLPNIVPLLVVNSTLRVGALILTEAALSYFGVGVPPPTPTWGGMVADGRLVLDSAWWVSALPGILIVLVVIAFNYAGDGLRDVLDPRRRSPGD